MIPLGTIKQPLDVSLPRVLPLRRGMAYGMLYGGKVMQAPNVPPMQRQSLAQQTLIHREQESSYISTLRNYGLRPDYPAFHAHSLVRKTPVRSVRPAPVMGRYGYGLAQTSSPGNTGSQPRFRKALRTPINQFNPPIYGDSQP